MSENKESLFLKSGEEYTPECPSLIINLKRFANMCCPHCGSDNLKIYIDCFYDFVKTNGNKQPRIIYRCLDCYAADHSVYAKNISDEDDEDDKNTTEEADKKAECSDVGVTKEFLENELDIMHKENHDLRKLVRILLEKVE